VPRAGGRCLDVVRLMRITAGSPVVEATSLRCQAVLEAFRGRTDAARRLISSAREMLEELGQVHGLLEADVFAAIVELGAGDLDAADRQLRGAYQGLRRLGADADAARAGALLARVEIDRGNLEMAEDLARQAEELAGDDLQAGILWRRVQAEVLARRSCHEEAVVLAEAAVAMAADTDALMHQAEACVGLAAVRRAAGDQIGADRAASQAVELYDRKGASALAAVARAMLSGPSPATLSAPAPRFSEPLANAAVVAYAGVIELQARQDWDSLSEVLADDVQVEDRRPLTRVCLDRAGAEQYMKFQAEQGAAAFGYRVLATRGDRLALLATEVSQHSDGSEFFFAGALDVVQVGRDGRITNTVLYSSEDIDGAFADLDDRYVQGEGAPFAVIFRLVIDMERAAHARDWLAVGEVFAPDVIIHDHHSGGLAERHGRRDTVDAVRRVSAEQPDARWTLRAIHEPSSDVMVTTIVTSGDAAEVMYHNVLHRGPDGIDRVDSFAAHDLDSALETARSLRSGPGELSNRCTEIYARYWGLFAKRDWEAMRQLLTEDAVYHDRRPVVRTLAVGSAIEAQVRQIAANGVERIAISVLATRGDRLALMKVHAESSDPTAEQFADESLTIIEITDSGRLLAGIGFAVEDLDSAVAELDRRYIEGEGAPYARLLSENLPGWRALDERDWNTFRGGFAPHVVIHDHQWGLAEATGPRALEDIARRSMDAVPGSHVMVRRILATSDHALAVEVRTSYGAVGTSDSYTVSHLGPSGLDRFEIFGPDALEDALTCYHRLAAPSIDAPLSNRCAETYGRVAEHFAARDWDGFTAGLSDGFVYDDHRSVVNTQSVGRRDAVTHMKIAADQGADRLAFTPLAVRGASLALLKTSTPSADTSFGSVMLALVSGTDDGRLESTTVYDLTDEDRAIAELDRRYIEGEGAPFAAVLIPALAGVRAVSERDWEAFRASYAPDYTLVEHIYSDWGGASDRDASEALVRDAIDATPGSRLMVRRIHAVSDRAIAIELCLSQGGTGRSADTLFQSVARLGPAGIDRAETFRADALDDAMAAYGRLAAPALDIPSNRSTETQRRICEYFATRDWDAFTASMSEGFIYDDHRSVVNTYAVGRRDAVAHMRVAAEQGADRLAFTALGVRGANHALVRMGTQSNTDVENSFASVMLAVISNTNDGRQDRVTVYDLDDEDRAIADLERRYVEGEGAPYAEILTLFAQVIRAFNQRDWDHLRSAFSPAVAKIDHYSAGWNSRRGRADTLADFVEFANSLSGARVSSPQIHACTTDALLATTIVSGRFEEGGTFELAFHTLYHRTGRFVDHMETFGPDSLDGALAAYRRLTTDSAPRNRCTEVFGRWTERFAARDWDGLDALVTDDFLYVDHRPVARQRQVGRGISRRISELLAEQGDRVAYTVLATHGERHALLRLGVQSDRDGEDFFASVMLGVVTSSPDDRFASITVFGLDDEDRARAEFEVQYQDSEMAP
jgi:hypothetical protein